LFSLTQWKIWHDLCKYLYKITTTNQQYIVTHTNYQIAYECRIIVHSAYNDTIQIPKIQIHQVIIHQNKLNTGLPLEEWEDPRFGCHLVLGVGHDIQTLLQWTTCVPRPAKLFQSSRTTTSFLRATIVAPKSWVQVFTMVPYMILLSSLGHCLPA
jgi:hypothetical protein